MIFADTTPANGSHEHGRGRYPRAHIAYVLNHVDGGSRATKIYDRYAYDAEKRIAVETWTRRLNAIAILANEITSADIRPFQKGG